MRDWLKEIRTEKGMSQAQVAEKVGITEQYYNLIENGRRQGPVNTAKKIAAALGFDWQLFYADEEV